MFRFTRLFSRFQHIALVTALTATGCAAELEEDDGDAIGSGSAALSHCGPPIPAALAVPDGNKLAFALEAEGVQIYECKAGADGAFAWVFRKPEAELYNHRGRLAGVHYAGPTWEALDGSTVVGTRVAGVTVDASAIPLLLLQAASHTGSGRMAEVTYIQRVNTTDGLAPVGGCDATVAGTVTEVDYTATYNFYEAKGKPSRP